MNFYKLLIGIAFGILGGIALLVFLHNLILEYQRERLHQQILADARAIELEDGKSS